MEFKDFLKFINEAESTAEKDDKAEKAGKKVAKDIEHDEGHKGKDDDKAEKAGKEVKKDIEYDDKKDKKKSLKEWFDEIDQEKLNEAEQIEVVPAKQTTSVIKKGGKTLGSVSNPQLAQQIKQSIGKGEMSLAGTDIKEEEIDEVGDTPAGREALAKVAARSMKNLGQAQSKKGAMIGAFHGADPSRHGSERDAEQFKKAVAKGEKATMAGARALDRLAHGGYKAKDGANRVYGRSMDADPNMREEEVEESGLQAYLGKKKYGEKGMKALQKAGREGASKEKMAQIRAKHDKLDEVQVDEKAKNPYAIGMAAAKKAAGIKKTPAHDLPKSVVVKGHEIAKKIKKKEKADEGEIPHSGPDYGAGLGAGRKDNMLEAKPDFLDLDKDGNKKESMKKAAADKKKKQVKESMDKCKVAYHEGKACGMEQPHHYNCRYDKGSPEHESFHRGFKEGLDECYGLMPVQGLVVGETMPPATVPGMASAAMPSAPAMEADVGEGNAFTAALAKTDKGDKFTVGGKTFTDKSNYDSKVDEYAFESLQSQLDELLKEDTQINEGLNVNMSQGIEGMGDDSVSVTATGDDSSKLLDFIKSVGLGGLGSSQEVATPAEPAVAVVSDYGAPKFSGHDDMAALIKKVGVDDEEGHTHDHKPEAKEGDMCGECGMAEAACGCEKEEGLMGETQTADQMTDEMAEDAAADAEEAETTADENAEAAEDSALAKQAQADKEVTVNEGGDGMEDEEAVEESSEEKLDEWANEAGKKGTDAAFERDINFMTKVISGGLNKPKSTGQTTIPVIAGQDSRTGDDDVKAWKRLAGLEK